MLLMLVLLGGLCYLGGRMGRTPQPMAPAPTPAAPPLAAAAPAPAPVSARTNVLLAGTDAGNAPGVAPNEGSRTDSMILLSLDAAQQDVTAVSLPRDTRVDLAPHGIHKLNAAYPLGGMKLLARAVAGLTGQQVDHVIRVDLAGFQQVVDALGGVDINVEKRMQYVDQAQHLKIDLKPGLQHLDGKHAMQYVRYRKDAEGDLGRMRRQQVFLRAVGKALRDPKRIQRLPAALNALRKHLETDLSPLQAMKLVEQIGGLEPDKVKTTQLPGAAKMINGVSWYLPSGEPALAVAPVTATTAPVAVATPPTPAAAPAKPAAPAALTPTVTIYNGSDRIGLEQVVAEQLRAKGIPAVVASEAVVAQVAQSRAYAGNSAAAAGAQQVAAALGIKASSNLAPRLYPIQSAGPGYAAVVLVLGDDFPR